MSGQRGVVPRVSVVMSVHNGDRYLQEAVQSVLNQTTEDLEFIVVDDGSTDGTAQILADARDGRMRVLTNRENRGLPWSLNRAVAEARGGYLARQDADDVSLPERLVRQIDHLDRHPDAGVVGVATRWIDADGRPLGKVWPEGAGNAAMQELLLRTCPLIHGSVMFRRRCFDEVGGYDVGMRTGQDYDLWLRISEAWDVVCLSDVLYLYRQHGGMASVVQEDAQARHAAEGLARAIARRKRYAHGVFGLTRGDGPVAMRRLSRRRLAQRYVWWSEGTRGLSRALATRFLSYALVLDPTTPEIWRYVGGTLARKAGR